MKNEDFIRDLNVILKIEYGAVLQYVLHSQRLMKKGKKKEADKLLSFLNDEIRHAEALAEKIKILGGKPTKGAKWIQSDDDFITMLNVNLDSEKESIKVYEKLIKTTEKQNLKGLNILLRDQLADEIEHAKQLQKYLGK
jgi:bacterioferritin